MFVLLSGHNNAVAEQISVGKIDMPLVIVCTEEDELCFQPVSWLEAQKLAKDYQAAGVILCYEGTPEYEAAIDFLGSPDDETNAAWTALQMVKEAAE